MEFKILKNKILTVENFFTSYEFGIVEKEIAGLRKSIEPTYQGTDVVLYRANMDQLFPDRKKSFILQAVQTRMYDDALLEEAKKIHDLSFTLMNKQHKFTTTLTEFRGDTNYRSHTDTGATITWTNIFMSWIWYYNPQPELMKGGDLVVEDLDLVVQPRNNRFVLMPAYFNHRINPAVYSQEDYYRTTINGFLVV